MRGGPPPDVTASQGYTQVLHNKSNFPITAFLWQ
jgi:hypothetical protein